METNANYRFVDYTMATPCEELIGSAERCLKAWRKGGNVRQREGHVNEVDFTYLGHSLTFSLFDESNCASTPLSSWFKLRNFAILGRTNDWTDLTPSETRSIFGALVCGAHASGNPLPVFFVSQSFERIEGTREVLGYEICGNLVRQYESNLIEADSRHEMFYLDGIAKYFKRHMFDFADPGLFAHVALIERFSYLHDGSPLHQYWSLANPKVSRVLGLPLEELGELTTTTMLVKMLRTYPDFYANPRSAAVPFLQNFSVTLSYEDINPDTVVDNDSYTTLIPSKQPPTAWSAAASFFSDDPGGNVFALGSAGCIRRILGLYVLAKACPSGQQFSQLSCDESAVDKAFSISSLLSARSRQAIHTLVHEGSEALSDFLILFHKPLSKTLKQNDISKDFDIISSPPVGTWASLLSVVVGCGRSGLETLAQDWRLSLKQLRSSWECGRVEDYLFLSTSGGRTEASEKVLPLWACSLWDDMLQKWKQEGLDVSLPDTNQSLFTQKLQMLHFCTASKSTVGLCTKYLGPQESKPLPLLRRLPTLVDYDAHLKFVAQCIRQSQSSGGDNDSDPYLQLKVEFPALVSDIRAYKHEFPYDGFSDFVAHYPLETDAKSAGEFSKCLLPLFTALDPCPACRQKPLFNMESEAEKALDFLESLTSIQFAAEILCAALSTICSILREQASEWISIDEEDVPSSSSSPHSSLRDLEKSIKRAISKVREDVAQFGGADSNSSISQDTLIEVDALCSKIDHFETWIVKARELDCLLTLPDECNTTRRLSLAGSAARRRLVVDLAIHDRTVAQDSSEARRLLGLAKTFSPGADHVWQSTDGRELSCSSKTFEVRTASGARMPECTLTAMVDDNCKRLRLSLARILL